MTRTGMRLGTAIGKLLIEITWSDKNVVAATLLFRNVSEMCFDESLGFCKLRQHNKCFH